MAQQENQYTQFMYTKMMFNPAFAGAREVSSVTALYRQQWIGFEGAPVSQLVSFDGPILGKKLGLGLNIHHHTIGQINNNYMVNMDYSYSLVKTQDVNLKIGIGGTFRYYQLDLTNSSVVTGNAASDPAQLRSANNKISNGNVGAGIYFTYRDFYIGASVPNIYRNILGNGSGTVTAQTTPHFYGMVGGLFSLSSGLDLKPGLIVKYAQNAPLSVDANLSFVFNKKFNLGASIRTGQSQKGESLSGLMFYQINEKFGLGAAYDYGLSELRSAHNGSFEMLLRYDFDATQKDIITNPRFFF